MAEKELVAPETSEQELAEPCQGGELLVVAWELAGRFLIFLATAP